MSERALSTHKTHAQVFLYRKESLGFSTEHYNKLHEVLSIDGEPSWGQSWNVAEGEPAAYNLYPLWNVSYFLQFFKRLEQRRLLQTTSDMSFLWDSWFQKDSLYTPTFIPDSSYIPFQKKHLRPSERSKPRTQNLLSSEQNVLH